MAEQTYCRMLHVWMLITGAHRLCIHLSKSGKRESATKWEWIISTHSQLLTSCCCSLPHKILHMHASHGEMGEICACISSLRHEPESKTEMKADGADSYDTNYNEKCGAEKSCTSRQEQWLFWISMVALGTRLRLWRLQTHPSVLISFTCQLPWVHLAVHHIQGLQQLRNSSTKWDRRPGKVHLLPLKICAWQLTGRLYIVVLQQRILVEKNLPVCYSVWSHTLQSIDALKYLSVTAQHHCVIVTGIWLIKQIFCLCWTVYPTQFWHSSSGYGMLGPHSVALLLVVMCG